MAYLRTLLLTVLLSLALNPASAAAPRGPALSVSTEGYLQLVTQQLKGCYKTCRKSTDPKCFSLCKSGGTLQENAKKYRATTCTKQCGAHDVECTKACVRKLKRDD